MYGEVYLEQKLALSLSIYVVAIFKVPLLKVELAVQIPPTLFGYTTI